MKRKLYFMLPDIKVAHRMMDQLLLARIEGRNIHFLAKPEIPLGDLPEATVIEKTDSLHGIGVGAVIGAVIGMLGGVLVIEFPNMVINPYSGYPPQTTVIAIIALVGALFGAWWTSMLATAIPNSSLKPYRDEIARCRVLMIVTVPYHRLREVRSLIQQKCGDQCTYAGVNPPEHMVFP
ncbi:MAG: hypothetical protein Q7S51_10605 [Gallionellaceae bacterium]|nr:hypothetical protein [Gallionellaceae bacterium]